MIGYRLFVKVDLCLNIVKLYLQGTIIIKSANELMDFSKGEETQIEAVSTNI